MYLSNQVRNIESDNAALELRIRGPTEYFNVAAQELARYWRNTGAYAGVADADGARLAAATISGRWENITVARGRSEVRTEY